MGYIDNNLMKDESVVYRTTLHWIVFVMPIIIIIVAIYIMSQGGTTEWGFAVLLLGLILISLSFITFKTSEFGVTDKRILIKVGFIKRSSVEILLSKVEGIQVNQGVFGRMLDYGTITITGTGGTGAPFKRIKAPLSFRKMAQEQI